MENMVYISLDKGITQKKFVGSLCGWLLLNIDEKEWTKWARTNQLNVWQRFYDWCSNNGFVIEKCRQTNAHGKYVQLPLFHGKRMFYHTDLYKLAGLFVEKGLRPQEDISEKEFFKLIWPKNDFREFDESYKIYYSSRFLKILESDENYCKGQIFRFYLQWEGDYINKKKSLKAPNNRLKLLLYREEGEWIVKIYNAKSKSIIKTFPLDDSFSSKCLKQYFKEKYPSLILFKRHPTQENCWEETRFIPDKNEEGIALSLSKHGIIYNQADLLISKLSISLIRIHFSSKLYKRYFSEERPFRLVGGKRIDSHKYLQENLPYIEASKSINVLIDDELHQIEENGKLLLNLSRGSHILKFKNYKQISLKVSKP